MILFTNMESFQCLPPYSSNNLHAEQRSDVEVLQSENDLCNAAHESVICSIQSNQATHQSYDNNSVSKRQYSCLYSKHKTQKRKVWQDGRLIINGYYAVLHSACPQPGSGDPKLDQCELSRQEVESIVHQQNHNIEMEKFLVTIDGPWVEKISTVSVESSQSTKFSSSFQKVLSNKFRKPCPTLPPNPATKLAQSVLVLGKRRRPLQPGELIKKCYLSAEISQNQQTNFSDSIHSNISHSHSEQSQPYHNKHQTKTVTSQADPTFGSSIPTFSSSIPSDCSLRDMQNIPKESVNSRSQIDENNSQANPMKKNSYVSSNPQLPSQHNDMNSTCVTESDVQEKREKVVTFSANAFNPSSFYGEESDEEEEDTIDYLDSFPIQTQTNDTHADSSRNLCHNADQDQMINSDNQRASVVSAVTTLSTEQILGIFGCQSANVTTADRSFERSEAPKYLDVFTLPEVDDSSDEE